MKSNKYTLVFKYDDRMRIDPDDESSEVVNRSTVETASRISKTAVTKLVSEYVDAPEKRIESVSEDDYVGQYYNERYEIQRTFDEKFGQFAESDERELSIVFPETALQFKCGLAHRSGFDVVGISITIRKED